MNLPNSWESELNGEKVYFDENSKTHRVAISYGYKSEPLIVTKAKALEILRFLNWLKEEAK